MFVCRGTPRKANSIPHTCCLAGTRLRSASLTMAAPMLEFRTRGYNPYAVKYSPYYDSRVAVASAANFGIVGNGRLFALGLTAAGIQVEKTYVSVSARLYAKPGAIY